MNLNTWKKMKEVNWALIGFSMFALSVGSSAHADGKSDTEMYCTTCHDGLVVGGDVIGGGEKNCGNRGYQGWVNTINRMKGKSCNVPAASIPAMATYLTCLETGTSSSCSGAATTTTAPATTTTTTAPVTTTTMTAVDTTTTSTTTAPTTTSTATVTTTTTTTNMMGCKKDKKDKKNKDKKCKDEHGRD